MKSDFKSIPVNERPREKALFSGFDSLSDSQLLAIILKCGVKGQSVIELSDFIMRKYYNLYNLMNCNYKELIEIKGVKKAKAIEILAIMEIAKRIQKSKINDINTINSPDDIYEHFAPLIKEEKQENFMVVFMDIKCHVIKYEVIFVGGINSSIIDVNLILKRAIEHGSNRIICLHNHPSGDPTPSTQDILVTKKINMNAQILDIKLVDHVIIGKNGYVSLKKEGIF